MRDFTWQYFAMTGDVDAYLLYRDIQSHMDLDDPEVWEEESMEEEEMPD